MLAAGNLRQGKLHSIQIVLLLYHEGLPIL